jgi:hypothetical protein
VHIGKCGGVSTIQAVQESDYFQSHFDRLLVCHVSKPPMLSRAKYMFVVRNPISRTLSAFNWRYKHVMLGGNQRGRFWGEARVFNKYDNLNMLAEQLVIDGNVQSDACNDLFTLHHIKENIKFYLEPLLKKVTADQILCTATTENLDQDLNMIFGCPRVEHIHKNKIDLNSNRGSLSELARSNLRNILYQEYRSIEELACLKYTSNFPLKELLR